MIILSLTFVSHFQNISREMKVAQPCVWMLERRPAGAVAMWSNECLPGFSACNRARRSRGAACTMYEPLSAVLASVDLLQAILANVEQHEL